METAWPRGARIAAAVLIAVLLVGIAVAALNTYLYVGVFPWDGPVRGSETIDLIHASRFVHGGGLYRLWGAHQWTYPIYQPGVYLFLGALTLYSGTNLWLGRLAASLLLVLAAICAARTASRLGAPRWLAVTSGLALFSFPEVIELVANIRPDALALAIMAGGTLAIVGWEREGGRRRLWLTAALAIGLIVVKWNLAPVVLAWVVAATLKDWRSGMRAAVAIAAGAVAIFGYFQLTSNGAFLQDMAAFSRGVSVAALVQTVMSSLVPYPNPILAVGAAWIAWSVFQRRLGAVHLTWLAAALVLASSIKVGSASYYWAPLDLSSAVVLGPALAGVRDWRSALPVSLVCLIIAAGLLPTNLAPVARASSNRRLLISLAAANATASDRIAKADGPVLSDRPDLTERAGKATELEGFVFAGMSAAGTWNEADLVDAVRRHEFSLVVASFDLRGPPIIYQGVSFWPPHVAQAVRDSYCLSGTVDGDWFYTAC